MGSGRSHKIPEAGRGQGARRGAADAARLLGLIEAFQGKTVVVLGDVVADEYLHGKPDRISREAPVLILRYLSREVRLGGAANACHNLLTLGACVVPLGVVGDDAAGEALRGLFAQQGVDCDGLVTVAGRSTPMKTRILAGGYLSMPRQQVVRLDREPEGPVPPVAEASLLDRLAAWGPRADAVILSDYGYGTITGRLLDQTRRLAGKGCVVTADSRYDLLRFAQVTAATPNEPEVEQLLGVSLDGDKAVEAAGWRLLDRLGSRLLLVTRGAKGLALFERDGPAVFVPIYGTDEIADVTGAGDTVISAFTLALAGGGRPLDAARLANYAGGVVVMKRGTVPISRDELCQAVTRDTADDSRLDGHGPRS